MTEKLSNKQNKEKQQEADMSFWEHLEELRWHLIRSAIAVLILSVVAFIGRKIIFDGIILAPNDPDFLTNRFFCWFGKFFHLGNLCLDRIDLKIVNLNMSGQFVTHMYTSVIAGIVAAFPYIIWEFWRFLKPALKDKERKYARGAVLIISLLFFLGVLFGYFVIVPLTVNFFGGYHVSEQVANQISLTSYISTVVSTTFASGLVFELPVVVFFLTRVGIISPLFLKKTRKYTLVIILTLAAIITPPDVFSQILVSIPLYGLFEISIKVSEMADKRKEKPAG